MCCSLSKIFPQSSTSAANTKITSLVLGCTWFVCSQCRGPSQRHSPVFSPMAWLSGGARVRAAGVRIICDPPTVIQGLYSHPALICHSLCADDWRGAEEQNNYDIMSGWLSSSPSWSDTEDRNGQHFPQESNPPHTTICCLFSRRALHSGGGKICTSTGLDASWFLSKCLHHRWLKFRLKMMIFLSEAKLWHQPYNGGRGIIFNLQFFTLVNILSFTCLSTIWIPL